MTIALTLEEEKELWDEAAQNSPQTSSIEPFEAYSEMPSFLGNGYRIEIELHPELWLTIVDYKYRNDYVLTLPTSEHPLQFSVRIYLQAKVLELIALQLSSIFAGEGVSQAPPPLRSDTIAKIHNAKQIIFSRLDNPLSLTELAAIVGVSDRTLRRGFRELFGTTVFSYLTAIRMEKAERCLRERNMTVAEVANLVGYAHLGHFAAAFKRKYGITPRECLSGKKSVSGL